MSSKNIRYHARAISLTISLAQLYFAFMTVALGFALVSSVFIQEDVFDNVVVGDFFPNAKDIPNRFISIFFLLIIVALQIFLLLRLRLAFALIRKFQVGKFLNAAQSEDLYKLGKGFDYYSFLWYATHVIVGVFFYNDLTVLYSVLPYSLLFFLLGKIILIVSAVSKEGEKFKQENDLTI